MKEVKPENVSMFREYDDVMKRIIAESKREVAVLQEQRGNLVMTNREIEDGITRKQGQFEQWKRLEEQKLTDLKNKLNNEVIRREKVLEMGELDLSRRQEEIAKREKIGMKLIEKENKLNNDRLEVEKLRSSASSLMESANKKMTDASSLYSQANTTDVKAKESFSKATKMIDDIVKREHYMLDKEAEVSSQSKNIDEIRKIVDPKLAEIKLVEGNIFTKEKQLRQKEESVNAQIIEERSLLRELDLKEKKLLEREKQLNQREEDIMRKSLMSGIKNA